MKNMNAKHTLLFSEVGRVPGERNFVAKVQVHRWKCGLYETVTMSEEVLDGNNDLADHIHKATTIINCNTDAQAQRIGIARFDGLVAEYGVPDDDLFPF